MQFNKGHWQILRARTALPGLKWVLAALMLVTLTGLCAVTVHANQPYISKVDIRDVGSTVQITVTSSSSLTCYDRRLGDRYMLFDLYGRLAPSESKRINICSGGIGTVRCSYYKDAPPITRISVVGSSSTPYSVRSEHGDCVTIITVRKRGSGHSAPRPVSKPIAQPAKPAQTIVSKPAAPTVVTSEAQPVAQPAVEPQPQPVAQPAAEPQIQPVAQPAAEPQLQPVAQPAPMTASEKPVPGGAESQANKPHPPETESAAAAQQPVLVASAQPLVVAQAAPVIRMPRLISLDFVASDIHDVLKALAVQGGVNIVASPDVKGNVTVSLTKVTVDEALKLVANVSGFKYQTVEGAYVVGTPDNMKNMATNSSSPEDQVCAVVSMAHGDVPSLSKMIETQSPGVTVTPSIAAAGKDDKGPSGPTLVVLSGPKSSVETARALAESIEQSYVETEAGVVADLYEVKYVDVEEIAKVLMTAFPQLRVSVGPTQGFNLICPAPVAMGSSGQSGSGSGSSSYGGGSQTPATGVVSANGTGGTQQKTQAKLLILQGAPQDVERAKALLAKMDVAQPQITIEAKVVDISDTGAQDLGIQWGDPTTGLTSSTFSENKTTDDNPLSIGRFSRTGFQVNMLVKALVQQGRAKILANPNVMALDGKPASAFIGDEITYVIRVDRTIEGGTTVTTDTAQVGVQLNTISRINSDGYITMNLHPEVSVITKYVDTPGGLTLPQIARRYVDSTVRIKDGETIVIGGLIRDEEIKSMSGIPFLRDLPLIGELFKSRSTSTTHSEVMMFITPRVIKNM